MKSTETYKQMLPEAHKSAKSLLLDHACNNVDLRSSPRSSYLQATETDKRLNNCMHACFYTHNVEKLLTIWILFE